VARGTIAGLKPVGYEVVNLGSDEPHLLIDDHPHDREADGQEAKLEYSEAHKADVRATWANIDKARSMLGWRAATRDWSRGHPRLVEWYNENRTGRGDRDGFMKVMVVAGARPNFMKIAPVLADWIARGHDAVLVHTGQHYDASMSQAFFDDLGIRGAGPFPRVGGGSHAVQTARIMERFEPVLLETRRTGCSSPAT
jgi:hypothetical protein